MLQFLACVLSNCRLSLPSCENSKTCMSKYLHASSFALMGRPHMSLFLSEHDRSNAWCACVAKTALTPSSRCHKFAWELRTTNTKNRDQEEAKTASKAVSAAQCDPPHRWCVLIDVHAKQKQMSRFQLLVSAILPWVYLPGFQRLCYLAIWLFGTKST